MWQRRVEHALRNLGDRNVLNRSPLARLAYVDRLATERYKRHLLPRGLVLHDVLLTCVQRICRELGDEPGPSRSCRYLELIAEGLGSREISRQKGLSREHISRVYRRKALELVTEEFRSVAKNGEQVAQRIS